MAAFPVFPMNSRMNSSSLTVQVGVGGQWYGQGWEEKQGEVQGPSRLLPYNQDSCIYQIHLFQEKRIVFPCKRSTYFLEFQWYL